ncbi:MAG: DEAD/DEAH box helicase [Silvanigrellales bacterium]|nr:DEAD/DEAH box helicase [Silvanigrellales bacterium]
MPRPTPADLVGLWDELASKLTLHATVDENGEIVLLVYPNLAGDRNPTPQSVRREISRILDTEHVRRFLTLARLRPTNEDLRWDLPGLNRAVPLAAPRSLEAFLHLHWDERRGQSRLSPHLFSRMRKAARSRVRCVLRARALKATNRAAVAEMLVKLAETAPDSLTPSTLALADFLAELDDRMKEATSLQKWVAVSSDEAAVFANYREIAEASWRHEKAPRTGELCKLREERNAFLALQCMTFTSDGSDDAAFRASNDVPQNAVRQAALRGLLQNQRPTAPLFLPHLAPSVLREFVRQATRIREMAPVRPLTRNTSQSPTPELDADSGAREGSLKFASAWQTVLSHLRAFAFVGSRGGQHRPHRADLPSDVRTRAYEIRSEESLLPDVASWQMPLELPPFEPILFDEGAALVPACLRPSVALGPEDARRKALATDPARATLTLARALAVGPDALRGECRSPGGRTVPYAAEQLVSVYVRTIQFMPGVLGTLGLASAGISPHHPQSLSLRRAKPLRAFVQNPHRVDDLSGVTELVPRSLGERPGLLLDVSAFPNSTADVPVIASRPQQDVSFVLAFRPTRASTNLLDAQFTGDEALRRALEGLPDGGKGKTGFSTLDLEPVFRFEIDGRSITEQEWLKAKKHGEFYVLPDGTTLDAKGYDRCLNVYLLRKETLDRFERISLADVWKVTRQSAPKASDGATPQDYYKTLLVKLEGVESLLGPAFVERFRDVVLAGRQDAKMNSATALGAGPAAEAVSLRPYQVWGVSWLLSRIALGLGACLADDMGLGKTLQAIETIRALLKMHGKSKAGEAPRILIVCPKTLLLNWRNEWTRFAPEVEMELVDAGRMTSNAPVVVTSYSRLRARAEEFAGVNWLCVVLDEAQHIKNPGTALTLAVKGLRAKHRIALTGTPVENHARELWSLVDWMNEGWLGASSAFEAYTRVARTKAEKDLMLAPVRSLLEPVVLRRMKTDPAVALDLPSKIITTLDLDLTPEQEILYEAVVLTALGAQKSQNAFARSSRYLKAILHCKQICNHPDLFLRGEDDDSSPSEDAAHSQELRARLRDRLRGADGQKAPAHERSSKLAAIRDELLSLQDADGGILVFTQSLGMGALLKHVLAESGVPSWDEVPFLTGALSAARRSQLVDAFQDACKRRQNGDAPPVLIASLKAGGLGLNLTGATHVLHVDRWWNPASEDQATDRAHRIGQTRTVHVHHFKTVGTVEVGIAALIESKRALASDLLGASGAEGIDSLLKSDEGFLSLVDPDGRFSRTGLRAETRAGPHVVIRKGVAHGPG